MSFIKDETFGSALRLIAFGVDFGSANRRREGLRSGIVAASPSEWDVGCGGGGNH